MRRHPRSQKQLAWYIEVRSQSRKPTSSLRGGLRATMAAVQVNEA